MIPPINEFILWANCTNKCKFCLQNLKADHRCVLSEDEKLSSIQKTYEYYSATIKKHSSPSKPKAIVITE